MRHSRDLAEEVRLLRGEVERLRAREAQLAQLFATYMGETGLDRLERVARAHFVVEKFRTIIGSEDAGPGEDDDCAAVGRTDIAGFYASGVLAVNPRLMVTAAHCGPPFSTLGQAIRSDKRKRTAALSTDGSSIFVQLSGS